jgi:nicotinamidase/pyrazinamidase
MKALIVVDMVNDFVHSDGALFVAAGQKIIPAIKEKLKETRKNGGTIIYLRDTHAEDDAEFKLFPKHCVIGTWGNEVINDLEPDRDDIIVYKRRFSGFFGTSLDKLLLEYLKADEVDVVGVCTSICVMDTVQGLGYMDIKTNVYANMTADLTPKDHAYALNRMKVLYGANIV